MRDWKATSGDQSGARLATVAAYAAAILGYWCFTLPDVYLYDLYSVLLLVMWTTHFARRIYESIATQKFTRASSTFEAIGGVIYYGGFGAAIGYQNNYYMPETIKMWIGLEFWIIGEYGNYYHHHLLGNLRKPQNDKAAQEKKEKDQAGSRWQIPQGGLFSLVSAPHYFFEVVSWLGFVVASGFSISSLLFMLGGAYVMFGLAKDKHEIYKKTFNGENGMPLYPKERKIVVPFVY